MPKKGTIIWVGWWRPLGKRKWVEAVHGFNSDPADVWAYLRNHVPGKASLVVLPCGVPPVNPKKGAK